MKLKHVWHPIMLDSGEHWCIVCHAKNGELAPTCPGRRLAAHLHEAQRKANELSLGPDTWVITIYDEDWSGSTTVRKGDKVAP
jgi:hypothetical protein